MLSAIGGKVNVYFRPIVNKWIGKSDMKNLEFGKSDMKTTEFGKSDVQNTEFGKSDSKNIASNFDFFVRQAYDPEEVNFVKF